MNAASMKLPVQRIRYIFFLLIFITVSTSAIIKRQVKTKNALIIQFQNFVGSDSLLVDSMVYKNEMGQSYTISKFKYYISNIHLKESNGSEFISNGYFLIDEEEENSKQILLNEVPDRTYNAITFTLGVDSLHNCSGLQSGDLDPVKGMFWAWNTGYVFLKLEGKSPQSKSPGNMLEFHIGGFREPYNCIRNFSLSLEKKILKTGQSKIDTIRIKTDVSEIFKNPLTIDFAKTSSVTDFHHSTTFADNYMDIFSIMEVK